MSEHRTIEQRSTMTDAEAIQAVAERGQVAFVVFGVYSDRSSAKILGVYTDQWQAEDRVQMLREGEAVYQVNYVKVPLNKTFGVELRS